jgi:hypothetical protein
MSHTPLVVIEKVEIHNHNTIDTSEIISKLNFITKQQQNFMANTQERFDLLMSRLNVATNDIAADYKKLLDEIKSGNVSDASLTAAEENIAKLETLGASVENPVPEETP